MPDANKIAALRRLPYVVHRTCGNCLFGRFASTDWGFCSRTSYDHMKHGKKFLGANRSGSCPEHQLAAMKSADLERSGFGEFVEEEP